MDAAECNYTSKKRHRVSTDGNGAINSQSVSYGSKTAPYLLSEMGSSNFAIAESPPSLQYPPSMHKLTPRGPHSIDPIPAGSLQYKSQNHHLPFDSEVSTYRRSPSHTLHDSDWRRQPRSSISVDRSRTVDPIPIEHVPIEPWGHPDFVSLPRAITHTVRALNGSELPNRRVFDNTLGTFLLGLSVELQETAAFSLAHYASIADSLYRHDTSALPPRLRSWALCHHVRSGSRKRHLILVPRESFYGSSRDEEETAAAMYIKQVDEDNGNDVSGSGSFERIPVQSQIFDILLYAHRAHSSPTFMLADIRRVGMVSQILWNSPQPIPIELSKLMVLIRMFLLFVRRVLRSQWRSFSYVSAPHVGRGSGVGDWLITRPILYITVDFMVCTERCGGYSSLLLCAILTSWISCAQLTFRPLSQSHDHDHILSHPSPLPFISLSDVILVNSLGIHTFVRLRYMSG